MKRKSYLIWAGIIVLSVFTLSSCDKEEIDYVQQEKDIINSFLTKYSLDIEPTESGLYFMDEVVGTGDYPVEKDTVAVYYTGLFLNGVKFDGNVGGDPFEFVVGVSSVIDGWHEGLQLIREGGEAVLIIPSWLAYGTSGRGSIPGYTPLYFKVELLEIRPGPDHK